MTECDKAQLSGIIGTGLTRGSWGEGLQVLLVAVSDGGDSCRDKHWCSNGVQGSRARKCLLQVQELIIMHSIGPYWSYQLHRTDQ